MTVPKNLAIGWRASSFSGWGIYGLNLTIQHLRKGGNPVWILPPHMLDTDKETEKILFPIQQRQLQLSELLRKTGLLEFDFPVLHSLRNDFQPALKEQISRGSKNVGVIFFEDTNFSPQGLERALSYDLIITGSTWNKNILEARGLTHVVNVFQGIDHLQFNPKMACNLYPERFIVFSGGKLEYRKAQDVVIAAFRQFHAVHKDALLLCAWANQWPAVMSTIANSPLVEGAPKLHDNNRLDLASWLENNGLPEGSFIDLGMPANRHIPKYLASSNTAIFPNRCEPGTNLVAMEAMAVGLPVILSANTGHTDLIRVDNCYPLLKQTKVTPYPPYTGVEGWAEPDVADVLAHLEAIYTDNTEAQRRGRLAAQSLKDFTWEKQIGELLGRIEAL